MCTRVVNNCVGNDINKTMHPARNAVTIINNDSRSNSISSFGNSTVIVTPAFAGKDVRASLGNVGVIMSNGGGCD